MWLTCIIMAMTYFQELSPQLLSLEDAETTPHPSFSCYLFSIENKMGKTISQLTSHFTPFTSPSAGQPLQQRSQKRLSLSSSRGQVVSLFLACLLSRGSPGACQHHFPSTMKEWSYSYMIQISSTVLTILKRFSLQFVYLLKKLFFDPDFLNSLLFSKDI